MRFVCHVYLSFPTYLTCKNGNEDVVNTETGESETRKGKKW